MFGTILSVVGGINTAIDFYKKASTLINGDSTERVLKALHGINANVERLSDHIVYTDFAGLRDTTRQMQGPPPNLREARELLEPVQRAIGGDIVSSALLATPAKMRDVLAVNPWAVLHNITPHHLAMRPHDPNMVPVMFEHGGVRYIGWQMRGTLPMLFDCELRDLPGLDAALRPAAPIMAPGPQFIARPPTLPPAAEQRPAAFRGRLKVDAAIFWPRDSVAVQGGWLKPGAGKTERFKDLDAGPELVVVPAKEPFAIGRFALTFAEWDAAQAHPDWQRHSGIAPRAANDWGWGRGKQPAIDVSWHDAKAYCAWLSAVTGKTYRLPSEAEWEQCCRAGTPTEFWWGNDISTDQANYDGNYTFGNGKKGEYRQRTVPVDSFAPNPWGLYQVHGNVWEWCEDAYDASNRVLRGGSWNIVPRYLRAAIRIKIQPDYRVNFIGFRVARSVSR